MKKLILAALLLLPVISFGQAKVQKDAKGNYLTVKEKKDSLPDSNTGKTLTDSKGNVWPVFKSAKGRIYALRTSATGKKYKQYLDREK